MYKASLPERLRYSFDNTMSKGTIALIGLLGLLSALVVVMAVFVTVVGISPEGGEQFSFPEAIWQNLMRALDSGAVGGDTGWTFRLTMLLVTFGGIFIISTLIGVLTSGIESKVENLRKGRSHVIESGHTVVRHSDNAAKAYGVVVNPTKSELVTFAEWDRIIVLAEE